MPNLFDNKLFLQYLAGTGAAIGGEGSVAEAIGGITQQNIAAQNKAKLQESYVKMLGEILRGGGKVNLDKDNVSIKAPKDAFGTNVETGNSTSNIDVFSGGSTNFLNPSLSQPQITGADVAGLSTQDVTQALAGALDVNKLIESKISDANAQRTKLGQKLIDALSKDTRSAKEKLYDRAVSQGFKGNVIDFEKAINEPGKVELYEYYVDQERASGRKPKSFYDWMYSIAKAGGISLGELVQRRKEYGRVDAELEVQEPNFDQKVLKDLQKDPLNWYYPPQTEQIMKQLNITEDQAIPIAQQMLHLQELDKRIKQAYKGKTVERRKDGWYVNNKLVRRNPYGGE